MSKTALNKTALLKALRGLGEGLDCPGPVEVLLIGGGSRGMITGVLRPERTTGDCDIISYDPPEARAAVREAAAGVAAKLALPDDWLDDRSGQLDVLPPGWKARRHRVGAFGKLVVFAADRLDLLAMKFYANRPQDREDIGVLQMTGDEAGFVRRYLEMLKQPNRQHIDLDQVEAAILYWRSLGRK